MSKQRIELIARGIVERDGAVLVCRNLKGGYCYLPGGHVEFSESAPGALAREFAEESGLAVRVGRMLSVHELRFNQKGRERHEVSLLFHVELEESTSEVRSLEPEIGFEWVGVDQLASNHFRPFITAAWLCADPRVAWVSGDER